MTKLFLTGSNPLVRFELEPGFNTVGRNPTNDFRVRDATVSSFHCEIVVGKDNAAIVRDLGSTNGTFINGKQVSEGFLDTSSALRLGSVELRLERVDEADGVRISIPSLPVPAAPKPSLLPDGCPACLNHSQVYASYRCSRCQKTFCLDCVRELGLAGGPERVFCPECSAPCESLHVPPHAMVAPQKKKSILGRLTQTLRIRLK